ncbi:FGGY family carbohydrate kinase [Swaminathania salitolerans]|uniref:Glycerol kinase n=1 Tax=Swaminathania salitolerans TaxID=182838 RepID=A0A511BNW6_9PROT|nr:FGGY family carbohydrate kinase [Swaminathania salitolerans]GBQ13711.1 glycerol kinase [Swaminathania salitolerans LMG 21291]GEL01762.1 glycerol kinase [Swaminathania salitolerans]
MKNSTQAIMAIDEGTSGTRSALVGADGAVTALHYEPLTVNAPRHGVVEQDANHLLERTVSVCRKTIAEARENGVEIVALAVANQRSTGVLWDKQTGRAIVPAIVWQDTRYASLLAQMESRWDRELFEVAGRPIAGYALYYWAAQHIQNTPEVSAAWSRGTLAFGTVDTWLLWNLSRDKIVVTTPTNAAAAGSFDLRRNIYYDKWIEAQGFPSALLPELREESDDFGYTDESMLGICVPIKASCGDQHGGMIGLGCIGTGQAMCLHGTGSFVDLVTGESFPKNTGLNETTFSLIAWRRRQRSIFAVETFSATTGSALNWACNQMGWFESPQQISELAAHVDDAHGLMFMPTLTGLRLPQLCVDARATMAGLSMSHNRASLARALLEGVAHSVVSCTDASSAVADLAVSEIIVGGGLSSSTTLLQLQADLGGVTVRHRPGSARATLRGAAFLAGCDGTFWDGLEAARATLPEGTLYHPAISSDERLQRRGYWHAIAASEVERVASGFYAEPRHVA